MIAGMKDGDISSLFRRAAAGRARGPNCVVQLTLTFGRILVLVADDIRSSVPIPEIFSDNSDIA